MLRTAIRHLFKGALVGGLGFLVTSWFRDRQAGNDDPAIPGKAHWPPLEGVAEPSDGTAADAPRGDWVAPDSGGDCPLSHPVKAKLSSGIYHVPDGASYERTNADRCYGDPAGAEADGYRAAKH